jgi:hypothetical protein
VTAPASWTVRYHVPYSQVHPGSRGGQDGAVHLHYAGEAPVALHAPNARGVLVRTRGQALCRPARRGWYEREPDAAELARLRCAECAARAARYGVEWPTDGSPVVLPGERVEGGGA